MDTSSVGCHPYQWVVTHGCVMPPRRGSYINNEFTVGYAAPKAHASPTAVLCHPYGVHWVGYVALGYHPRLCSTTATRFKWLFRVSVGCHPRLCSATATRFKWLFRVFLRLVELHAMASYLTLSVPDIWGCRDDIGFRRLPSSPI